MVGPNSLDQIVYVVLIWVIFSVVVTRVYNTSIVRLEIVVGTGILLIWAIWAVHYRLEQIQQERYKRK